MPIPADYSERVYAGVLGKIIGVYLGRPFEGWSYESLNDRFGDILYYVHEQLGAPLVVTDDDISGTFTFLRALPDHGNRPNLSPAEIGHTWLNYLIQNRTILWWGGMGHSTENTAFLRLKAGIPAPQSGSIATNGKTVAQQIGAQIFIDGWAMVCPGDPDLAADFARRAASVSHDGEAIYGAQVLAAMEAAAFVEPDLSKLLDLGVGYIPHDSHIYRLIADLREWRSGEPDWRKTRARLAERYGYQHYAGACHMVPNHGVIILALLYGEDNFQKSLMVANTAGWDTDCNSGNVGCLMGIKTGLAGLDAGPDWRGPVADRMYLPTADGGRCVTDALSEAGRIVTIGRSLAGELPDAPANSARFHFSLPGSVQGFQVEDSPECRGTALLTNDILPSHSPAPSGKRGLKINYSSVATGRSCRVATATFIPQDAAKLGGYSLVASPTLYPGQKLSARLVAPPDQQPVSAGLFLAYYGPQDRPVILRGPSQEIPPGAAANLEWIVPETGGSPICEVGVEIASAHRLDGALFIDTLHWGGIPHMKLSRPEGGGHMWLRAWTNGVTHLDPGDAHTPLRVIQDEGHGIASQGLREWTDYTLRANVHPRLAGKVGLAVRVQGQRRFIALTLVRDNRVELIQGLGAGSTVLASADFDWSVDHCYPMCVTVHGSLVTATVETGPTLTAQIDPSLSDGAIGIYCADGRVDVGPIRLNP